MDKTNHRVIENTEKKHKEDKIKRRKIRAIRLNFLPLGGRKKETATSKSCICVRYGSVVSL
jgi:hypothetical protein